MPDPGSAASRASTERSLWRSASSRPRWEDGGEGRVCSGPVGDPPGATASSGIDAPPWTRVVARLPDPSRSRPGIDGTAHMCVCETDLALSEILHAPGRYGDEVWYHSSRCKFPAPPPPSPRRRISVRWDCSRARRQRISSICASLSGVGCPGPPTCANAANGKRSQPVVKARKGGGGGILNPLSPVVLGVVGRVGRQMARPAESEFTNCLTPPPPPPQLLPP